MTPQKDDWLKTPGIAHTSVAEMKKWTSDQRWRKSVVLGFGTSESARKIKENHDRHMNNLRMGYVKMKSQEEGVKEEGEGTKGPEEEQRTGNLPDMPVFGTQSSFADKKKVYPKLEPKPTFSRRTRTHGSSYYTNPVRAAAPIPSPIPASTTVTPLPTPVPTQQPLLPTLATPVIPNETATDVARTFFGFNHSQNTPLQQQQLAISSISVGATTGESKTFHQGKEREQSHGASPCISDNATTYNSPRKYEGCRRSTEFLYPPRFHSSTSIVDGATTGAGQREFTGFCGESQLYQPSPSHAQRDNSKAPMGLTWDEIDRRNYQADVSKSTTTSHPPLEGSSSRWPVLTPLMIPAVQALSQFDSPNASTPCESLLSWTTTPDKSMLGSSIEKNLKEEISDTESEDDNDGRVAFEKVHEKAGARLTAGCQNPVVKEKIRNYDRVPTDACKRYLNKLDSIQNSDLYKLTQMKFDKKRVKRWVARFEEFPPLPVANMEVARRRRHNSGTMDDAFFDCPDLLITTHEPPPMDEGMRLAEQRFAQFHKWMSNRRGEIHWPLEDAGRIAFPKKDWLIEVRVVAVAGLDATVVPALAFEDVSNAALDCVQMDRLPRLPATFNNFALVILEQESDFINVSEYRRGWVFDGTPEELSVLLIDERRIVKVPRTSLFFCPETVTQLVPPLAVAVKLDREVMEHERRLLLKVGCTVKCRVEGGGEDGEPLKLSLVRINTEDITLDLMWCSEVCAGACAYHQDEDAK